MTHGEERCHSRKRSSDCSSRWSAPSSRRTPSSPRRCAARPSVEPPVVGRSSPASCFVVGVVVLMTGAVAADHRGRHRRLRRSCSARPPSRSPRCAVSRARRGRPAHGRHPSQAASPSSTVAASGRPVATRRGSGHSFMERMDERWQPPPRGAAASDADALATVAGPQLRPWSTTPPYLVSTVPLARSERAARPTSAPSAATRRRADGRRGRHHRSSAVDPGSRRRRAAAPVGGRRRGGSSGAARGRAPAGRAPRPRLGRDGGSVRRARRRCSGPTGAPRWSTRHVAGRPGRPARGPGEPEVDDGVAQLGPGRLGLTARRAAAPGAGDAARGAAAARRPARRSTASRTPRGSHGALAAVGARRCCGESGSSWVGRLVGAVRDRLRRSRPGSDGVGDRGTVDVGCRTGTSSARSGGVGSKRTQPAPAKYSSGQACRSWLL